MNLKTKRKLTLSLGLILLGGLLVFFGFLSVGFDIYAFDKTEYTQNIITSQNEGFEDIDSNLQKVVLDFPNVDLTIKSGDEFEFKYFTSEYSVVESNLNDKGEFNFKLTEDKPWTEYVGSFRNMKSWLNKNELIVPSDIEISFNGSNLELTVEGEFENLILDIGNADIELDSVTAQKVAIKGSNSNIEVKNSNIGELSTESNNSRIEIEGGSYGRIAHLGHNGSFRPKNLVADSISAEGNNMSVRAEKVNAESYLFLGSNCSIRVEHNGSKTEFALILIKGTNSSSRIDDEKSFSYSGTGTKTFNVSGNNLSVRVEFCN